MPRDRLTKTLNVSNDDYSAILGHRGDSITSLLKSCLILKEETELNIADVAIGGFHKPPIA